MRPIQTHISHVFLTGTRVYKLRKAVDLGFLDFSSRARRNRDCLDEVALNRRLAPDVYLGVAAVRLRGRGVEVGAPAEALAPGEGGAEPPEHVVVMRRLPDGTDALSRLERGTLRARHLDLAAERVARFHAAHPLAEPPATERAAWLASIVDPVEANLVALEAAAGRHVPAATLRRVAAASRAFVADHAGRFEARRGRGRAVDGHGDLHLQHVWFESDAAAPLFVDCIEFSPALRRIDAASDVAFLAMDLVYRHRPAWAARFLRRYAREADDYDLFGVVDWFQAYRAAVRAKVATLAADEPEVPPAQRRAAAGSARRHLALAARLLRPPGRGGVLLVCGAVGSGKSTAAERAADAVRGVVVASDRVRRRLSDLPPDAPAAGTGWGSGRYSRAARERVYAGLLERAAPVVDSGRIAVLDATYDRRERREAVRAWARARGAPLRTLWVSCAEEVARERLAQRSAAGVDASKAGPQHLAESLADFEVPTAAEAPLAVATDARGWRRALDRALARWRREEVGA